MCVKYLYLIDGRISEAVGLVAPSDVETTPIGPIARSLTFNDYEGEEAAIFEVKTAKRRQERGAAVLRMCAMPLLREYEPWTREVVSYFNSFDENDLIFPFTRQKVWKETKKCWKDLSYNIDPYTLMEVDHLGNFIINDDGEKNKLKVEAHWKTFTLHAVRHIRTGDLVFYYGFSVADLSAIGGWSLSTSMRASRSMRRYIQFAWRSYFPKLLKERY